MVLELTSVAAYYQRFDSHIHTDRVLRVPLRRYRLLDSGIHQYGCEILARRFLGNGYGLDIAYELAMEFGWNAVYLGN